MSNGVESDYCSMLPPNSNQTTIAEQDNFLSDILPCEITAECGDTVVTSPCVLDLSTPNMSMLLDDINDVSVASLCTEAVDSNIQVYDNAKEMLRKMRVKHVNRVIIGTLNINSLASKFEQLREIIGNYLDILVIQETKLDSTFPDGQFLITGYKTPYRLDRNRHGGGVMVYVREDIPSNLLDKHNFTKKVEGLFIEINLRKSKLLLFGTYHSTHPVYGLSDSDYFEQLRLALDVYSNFDRFLLAGDFNIEEKEPCLEDFLYEYNSKNLVKDKTCFKSAQNPSCIDLLLTNSHQSFLDTTTVATGLSDFHNMAVTVMKTTFPKAKPKVIQYRDYKAFVLSDFRTELRNKLFAVIIMNYDEFEEIFLEVLNKHAPFKKKILRANDKPYMTKALRKAIMRRSALKNRFNRDRTTETEKSFKKQKNYTNRLLKKEKKKYFANLNLKNYTDNKKFWNTVKPLFSNYSGLTQKITLVEDQKIITNDEEVARVFNDYFIDSTLSLGITESKALQNNTEPLVDPVKIAMKFFSNHPSILEIKANVTVESRFSVRVKLKQR